MKIRFVSEELLKWNISVSSSSFNNHTSMLRPYEMIKHSESLITPSSSEFNLADGIANLKRAINHRLQIIESIYKLKDIKFKNAPKGGYLELLECYGLAKPYIIKLLMEIRNRIEHDDAKPPKKERCQELLDITWYFLKSTDKLVYSITNSVLIEPVEKQGYFGKYGCDMHVDFSKKVFKMSGWIPSSFITTKKENSFFQINCTVMHDGEFWRNKDSNIHKDKTKEDIWIIGNLKVSEEQKKEFLIKILTAN
ncbi:hypothetical protein [Ferruginibacter albus]|uniref:hypothetical protein n=1 Tax=Ferruginibacter albus TaxID=2875540 RepID=UPI001CC5408B|nr:hypothetical protein [Ferruginibacter albus]UAY50623.1 hypothetical protein K9M53_08445 [Ferruginibacter albus]